MPNYSEEGYIFKYKINLGLFYYRKQLRLKHFFRILSNHVKFQLLTSFFQFSDLYKLSTTASSDQHNFGLIRHRNMNSKISYESLSHILSQQYPNSETYFSNNSLVLTCKPESYLRPIGIKCITIVNHYKLKMKFLKS